MSIWAALGGIGGMMAGAGGLASIFTGGQRKPTWYEREMGGTSARLMRGAAPLEASRLASLADLFTSREGAMDVLRSMYGGTPIYTPSPLLGPIREGLYGAFDPSAVRSSPLYTAAKENILSEAGEARERILSTLGARGALRSGASEISLENLERGTTGLLNQMFLRVADVERQERTNRINMALGLLTGNVTGGATQMASTAGTLSAGAREPAQPAAGGGLSSLAASLMLRQYLAGMNKPGAATTGFPTDYYGQTLSGGAYVNPYDQYEF